MDSRAGRIEKKLTDVRGEFKLLQRKKIVENILRSRKSKKSVGFVNQRHTLKETVIRSDFSTVKKQAI